MSPAKKLIAVAAILFIAVIIITAKNNPSQPRTITLHNWEPIINNSPPEAPTGTPPQTTPEAWLTTVPYSAREIIFTITYLDKNTLVSGTVKYAPAANILQEKIYINGTPAAGQIKPDPFTEIINKIARIITLTPGEALSNKTITILGHEITLNTRNTRAIITLIGPEYAYITYMTTPITVDLRWLKPSTHTATTGINLPIVDNPALNTIYSDGTLTIFYPETVNGEIITEYNTSSTLFYIILFNDRIIYNGTLLTPLHTFPLATNSTTTITLAILTRNPIYSIPPTIMCTRIGGARACHIGTITIAFNRVVILFKYTTTMNGVILTIQGWMAYPGDNKTYTEITVTTHTGQANIP